MRAVQLLEAQLGMKQLHIVYRIQLFVRDRRAFWQKAPLPYIPSCPHA
jgi:hypothetical protein